jgi:type IV pilus assembly protein PilM
MAMDASSVVWGLDIGHTSIKAVKLERSPGGARVLGYAIEPIPSGENVERDEAVVKALSQLATREQIGIAPVFAALSGRQVLARSINVPVINEKKVDRIIELEARQQIPGNFDEVRWGYHMSPGLDGASFDVALFAARKEVVDDLIGKCKRAGLTLAGVSVTSLAVYNFIKFDQDFAAEDSVVILDVGAENTDLVVYQGDTLWMRSLGVSGNDITRTFQKKFRVGFEEAEQLKCQVGDSRQSDRILKVVESSLVELCGDVQRSLGFYKGQNSHAKFGNVVVSGNTFRLPGLPQFMADRLGYAIITLIELEKIEVTPGLDREHFLEDLQSLGVAMGLGLQGLGVSKANVNLLPSALQLQSILRQKRWAMVALLLLVPALFLANHLLIRQPRLEEAGRQIAEMDQSIKASEKFSKDALAQAKNIPEQAEKAAQFARYWEQVGLHAAIEQGVFAVVAQLAADDSLTKSSAGQGDPRLGHSPFPQPLYLDVIEIPVVTGEGNDSVDPFIQHSAQRVVTVTVLVPLQSGDLKTIRPRMIAALKELKQSTQVYRALNPSLSAVPEQLPALFSNVDSPITDSDAPLSWTFFDPYHKNAENRVEPKHYENIALPARAITFACTLATR